MIFLNIIDIINKPLGSLINEANNNYSSWSESWRKHAPRICVILFMFSCVHIWRCAYGYEHKLLTYLFSSIHTNTFSFFIWESKKKAVWWILIFTKVKECQNYSKNMILMLKQFDTEIMQILLQIFFTRLGKAILFTPD